jgi:hypothetical protein
MLLVFFHDDTDYNYLCDFLEDDSATEGDINGFTEKDRVSVETPKVQSFSRRCVPEHEIKLAG